MNDQDKKLFKDHMITYKNHMLYVLVLTIHVRFNDQDLYLSLS